MKRTLLFSPEHITKVNCILFLTANVTATPSGEYLDAMLLSEDFDRFTPASKE